MIIIFELLCVSTQICWCHLDRLLIVELLLSGFKTVLCKLYISFLCIVAYIMFVQIKVNTWSIVESNVKICVTDFFNPKCSIKIKAYALMMKHKLKFINTIFLTIFKIASGIHLHLHTLSRCFKFFNYTYFIFKSDLIFFRLQYTLYQTLHICKLSIYLLALFPAAMVACGNMTVNKLKNSRKDVTWNKKIKVKEKL